MKSKWILHTDRDILGNGSIVANYNLSDLEEYPICIIRSYATHYHIEIFGIRKKNIDIPYDDKILRRLDRKLMKKEKKGYLTSEQCTKIKLFTLCTMVEDYCILLKQ